MGDDESNILRLYRVGCREPEQAFDLNNHLAPEIAYPEADIEGACRVANRSYWITSHGRNRNGELRRSRYRFFAVDLWIAPHCLRLTTVGVPYTRLVNDLSAAPHLAHYNFRELQYRPPKSADALAIEGLAPAPDGDALLIGFRNPVPNCRALVIPLLNPDQLLSGDAGAQFGEPIELDLGGRGVREIDYVPQLQSYLIVAGAIDARRQFAVFRWSGAAADAPRPYAHTAFGALSPEALIAFPGRRDVLLLSDDGTRRIGEQVGKEVASARQRGFRTIWFTP
ncbi:MAG: DUF3616 domain-containing protein [Planctomycetia bacterium]|nr:DUF3616 domain-containing protein [Planctomycetia bacterium]